MMAGAAVTKTQLLEHFHDDGALGKGIKPYLNALIFLAEGDCGLNQGLSDAPSPMILGDAKTADLTHFPIVTLHSDHTDDLTILFLGHPEMIAGFPHINRLNVVDVQSGVVLRELAAEQSLDVKLPARREIGGEKFADGVFGKILVHTQLHNNSTKS